MNLYYLTKTIFHRVKIHIEHPDHKLKLPLIESVDREGKIVKYDFLFNDLSLLIFDILILSDIWDKLIPDVPVDDEELNKEFVALKQIEIAKWLGGNGNIQDILLLMQWLSRKSNIDSTLIMCGL